MGGGIKDLPAEELYVGEIGAGPGKLHLGKIAFETDLPLPGLVGEHLFGIEMFELRGEKFDRDVGAVVEVGGGHGPADADALELNSSFAKAGQFAPLHTNDLKGQFGMFFGEMLFEGDFEIGVIGNDDGVGEKVGGWIRPGFRRIENIFVRGNVADGSGTAEKAVLAENEPKNETSHGEQKQRREGKQDAPDGFHRARL